MIRRRKWFCLLLALNALASASCDPATLNLIIGGGGDSTPGDANPGATDDPNSGADNPAISVGDVTPDGNGDANRPLPGDGVSVRVRNESRFLADVSLRFMTNGVATHLAFVRVPRETITTVSSAESAEILEISGSDEREIALEAKTLVFGVDFDLSTPAEYVIPAVEIPADTDPPSLTLTAPATDVTRTLGSTLLIRWTDESSVLGATIRIFLRSVDSTAGDLIQAGPTVGAESDGTNDELLIVLEGLEIGWYEVIGEIDDGFQTRSSIAPGLVHVVLGDNAPPKLTIIAPSELVELHRGDTLTVIWTDEDEDDNALITFRLAESVPSTPPLGPYAISSPLEEDPDGIGGDTASLTIGADVPPGLYDLRGTIDDGEALGTARVERAVRVLNRIPELVLVAPAEDIEVAQGQSLRVAWLDADDDDAEISIFLEPHPAAGEANRTERLLMSSISEDDATDEITLAIPVGVAKGAYRVRGEITDGLATIVTWAPGLVFFGVAIPEPPELSVLQPSTDVTTRLGETVSVQLATNDVPFDSEVRLFLSNLAYGGDVRVDVTPETVSLNGTSQISLTESPPIVPNLAWPRRFDLEAELLVRGSVTVVDLAAGSIWIRQEVEITDVDVNYTCPGGVPTNPDDRLLTGIRVTWTGGGLEEGGVAQRIQFWLALDGQFPIDGQEDTQHRLFHAASESPNVERVFEVALSRLVSLPLDDGEDLPDVLESGAYSLLTAVEPENFGRIISPPYPDLIPVCTRIR